MDSTTPAASAWLGVVCEFSGQFCWISNMLKKYTICGLFIWLRHRKENGQKNSGGTEPKDTQELSSQSL